MAMMPMMPTMVAGPILAFLRYTKKPKIAAMTIKRIDVMAVRKKSFTKNYRFGLHGYSNLLAGLTDLGTEQTVTNREGHELVPYFKKLFAARAKD